MTRSLVGFIVGAVIGWVSVALGTVLSVWKQKQLSQMRPQSGDVRDISSSGAIPDLAPEREQ